MQHSLKSSAKPSNFHMRVADIVNLPEDEGSDGDDGGTAEMATILRQTSEASCGLACASPRRMVSRLIRRLKDRGTQTQWRERERRQKEMVDQSRNVRWVEASFDRGEESALAGPTSSSGTGDPLSARDELCSFPVWF